MNNFYEKTYYFTKFIYITSISFYGHFLHIFCISMDIFTNILYKHFIIHIFFTNLPSIFMYIFYTNLFIQSVLLCMTIKSFYWPFFIQTFLYKPIYYTIIFIQTYQVYLWTFYEPFYTNLPSLFMDFLHKTFYTKFLIQIFSCKRF